MQKRNLASLLALVIAVQSAMAPAQDYLPAGPGNGAMPWTPAGTSPQPPRDYGIVPGPPSMPAQPVRPEMWPSGSPAKGLPPRYPAASGQGPMADGLAMQGDAPARPCEGAQILARVGSDVVLTSDVLATIDEFVERVSDKMPNDQVEAARKMVLQEVTAGIRELAAHIHDPDPGSKIDPQRRVLIQQLLKLQTETKLIYQDFRRGIPKDNLPNIEEMIHRQFDQTELPRLLKRENVPGRQELEWKLREKGSSLDREKRMFMERMISYQWRRDQVKHDKEITHEEMLSWYQVHLAEFETPARARWEELMVLFSKYPTKEEARAALAEMGNQVLAGVPLAQVAKARSDGPTASSGGQRDWTSKGSLVAEELDRALFGLPPGQLSPILEGKIGLHIIRVVDRQDVTRTSFRAAQADIKEKIRRERTNKQYQEYLARLQQEIPTWTIFDNPQGKPRMAEVEERRY